MRGTAVVLWIIALSVAGALLGSPDPEAVAVRKYVADPAPTTSTLLPPTTTAAPKVRTTTTTRPATTTTTAAPIAVPADAKAQCLADIAASTVPLAPGWREVCSPLPGEARIGGWAMKSVQTIFYDPEVIDAVARSWEDDDIAFAIRAWQVAHERCHTLEPWPAPEVFTDTAQTLAYERSIDACAARYGADIRFSIYALDKSAQGD